MPNVKYEKLIIGGTVVDEIWISKHRQAAVRSIVNNAPNLRKKLKVSMEDLIVLSTLAAAEGLRSAR